MEPDVHRIRKLAAGVTVVLVAYHGDRWLPACIGSLAGASAGRLHLVLVDNAGNTPSVWDELPLEGFDLEVLRTDRPLGFAEANNFALTRAAHLRGYVLFLNQDTISPPGWIDRCLDACERDTSLGALSPLIRTYDDTGWDPSFVACLPAGTRLDELEATARAPLVVPNAPAPALLVRTDVLRRTGPFDPVFGSYYEDYDLCRRIREQGYRIAFCHAARLRHFSGSSTTDRARELKRMRQIIRNQLLYRLREAGVGRRALLARTILLDFPRRLARGLLRTPSSQPPSVTLKAYGDLLRMVDRLVSRRRDEAAWYRYLEQIGWAHPEHTGAGDVSHAAMART